MVGVASGSSRAAGHAAARRRCRSSVRAARGSRTSFLRGPGAGRYAADGAVRERGFVGGCCLGGAEAHPADLVDVNRIEVDRGGERPEAGVVEGLVACVASGREEAPPICSRIQAAPAHLVRSSFLRAAEGRADDGGVGSIGGSLRTAAGVVRGVPSQGVRVAEAAEACGAEGRGRRQLSVSQLVDGPSGERRSAVRAAGRDDSEGACAAVGRAGTLGRGPQAVAHPFYRRTRACGRRGWGAVLAPDAVLPTGVVVGGPQGYDGDLRTDARRQIAGRGVGGLQSRGRVESLPICSGTLALTGGRSLVLRAPEPSLVADVGGGPRTRAGVVRGRPKRATGRRAAEATGACLPRGRGRGQLSVSQLADGPSNERRSAVRAMGQDGSEGAYAAPGRTETLDRVPKAVARPFYRRTRACAPDVWRRAAAGRRTRRRRPRVQRAAPRRTPWKAKRRGPAVGGARRGVGTQQGGRCTPRTSLTSPCSRPAPGVDGEVMSRRDWRFEVNRCRRLMGQPLDRSGKLTGKRLAPVTPNTRPSRRCRVATRSQRGSH